MVILQMMKQVQKVADENKDLVRKYHREMHLRKRYHNELVELKGALSCLDFIFFPEIFRYLYSFSSSCH